MKLSRKERKRLAREKRIELLTDLQRRVTEELKRQQPDERGNIDVKAVLARVDLWLQEMKEANPHGAGLIAETAQHWMIDFEAKLKEYMSITKGAKP